MEKFNEKKEDIKIIRLKIIDEILNGNHDIEDNSKLANYDAIFEKDKEPLFVNIWRTKKGFELGYIIFHDFLIRVGENNTFSSTDFEEAGEKLFKKAEDAGLIKQISEKTGLGNITRWEVTKDPKIHLEDLKEKYLTE